MLYVLVFDKKKRKVQTKSKENILAKKRLFKKFKWYPFFSPIDFGPIFVNQKRFF